MNDHPTVEVSVLFQYRLDRALTRKKAKRIIQRTISSVISAEGIGVPVEVSVVMTTDEGIRELNRSYHHTDAPTDVLAFHQYDQPVDFDCLAKVEDRIALGDVVVSADAVRRQAIDYNWTAEMELCLLIAHGTLHLLGYDDMKRETARAMERKQFSVLHSLYPDAEEAGLRRHATARPGPTSRRPHGGPPTLGR